MAMAPRITRLVVRTVHLTVALLMGTYVYAPAHVAEGLRPTLMFAAVPIATVTGVAMWKQGTIRRLLRRGRAPSTQDSAEPTTSRT